ncbi:Phthiocerol synthesis polyketide synthase type I PpsC [Poriferisphaera corsica]|uniref:Phthiocerol synthesis polyketide synthase type I PpsC n=1 Tax=Poriferisphaera corsica TaxID=2528020 RepID=A0A517YW73_9BACT|nr:zinc-binding dehydrogenase [Poriferisphaera corsica]QDU34480.1 Phthiocerol synthesis polyketide synthase type I PpsC [Poriferisphaera corsica]
MSTQKQIIVEQFGGPENLLIKDTEIPTPAEGQVLVKLTSIGMNHADLLARKGFYKIASGEPPFTPGIEGGGIIEKAGPNTTLSEGTRVVITPDAPRAAAGGFGGTYKQYYCVPESKVLPAPDTIPDNQLGALWLPYLTAWGCLVWKHGIKAGDIIAIPAASSSVALAAAQIAKKFGCKTIGLTTSQDKIDTLKNMSTAHYDHIVLTHDKDTDGNRTMLPWHKEMRQLTESKGVNVFFDPVASGSYLNTEIKCLAQFGVVYVYGLLGAPDTVDVTPLIRKFASITGWVLGELMYAGEDVWRRGCNEILDGFADGSYKQHVDAEYKLEDIQNAHIQMHKGQHIGKLVIVP